jgi:branched-chain amino acid transport system permease protein
MTATTASSEPASQQSRVTPMRVAKVVVLLALLIGIPPLVDSPFITRVFISALMLGTIAAIYDLMIGYAGLINFGYAGFLAVGAYGSALASFHYGISPWAGLLIGGVLTGAVGFVAGIITLRLKGLYVALMTFFTGEAIRYTISNTPDFTRGMQGLSTAPFTDILGLDFARENLLNYYFLLLVLAGIIMGLLAWLVNSRMGLAFKALREDQLATQSLGLNTTKYKLYNFTIASFLAGIMGAYYAHYIGILSPTRHEFGVPRTVEILTITYVGGRGSLWGALFAGFLLIGFQEYFRGLGPWRLVLFGSLLIFVMLFARRGLAGLKKYVW